MQFLTPSKPQYFDAVCQAIRAKDSSTLNEMLDAGIHILENYGAYSPIAYLAAQGEIKAVQWLITNYAVNPLDAALGFALGGHITDLLSLQTLLPDCFPEANVFTTELLKLSQALKCTEVELPILTRCVTALWRKDFAQLDKLLANKEGSLLANVVLIAARLGYLDYVNQLLKRSPDEFRYIAIEGYATANYQLQVQALSPSDDKNALQAAIRGYARGNHTVEVNRLLQQDARLKNTALEGYLASMHALGIIDLLNQYNELIADFPTQVYQFFAPLGISQSLLLNYFILPTLVEIEQLKNATLKQKYYEPFRSAIFLQRQCDLYHLNYRQAKLLQRVREISVGIDAGQYDAAVKTMLAQLKTTDNTYKQNHIKLSCQMRILQQETENLTDRKLVFKALCKACYQDQVQVLTDWLDDGRLNVLSHGKAVAACLEQYEKYLTIWKSNREGMALAMFTQTRAKLGMWASIDDATLPEAEELGNGLAP